MNVSFLYLQLKIFGIMSAANAMLLKLINEYKFSINNRNEEMLMLIGPYKTILMAVIKASRYTIKGMSIKGILPRLIYAYNTIPSTVIKDRRYSIILIRKC